MSIADPRFPEVHDPRAPQMTALRAMFVLAHHHGVTLGPEDLPRLSGTDHAPGLLGCLQRAGFRTRMLAKARWHHVSRLGSACPALVEVEGGAWAILVQVVTTAEGQFAALLDPAAEAEGLRLLPREAFEARWQGRVILARPRLDESRAQVPFGLRWFLPALAGQKGLLAGVAVAVILGNLISFALPLLFQVMIDKVIAHQAWNTLAAVVAVYVVLVGFDAGFTFVRHRLMQIAGGKVDAQVGARAFGHLMSLPLSVFEATPSGVLVRNMQLTENIRQFLTGKLFQTLLDALLLPVLLVFLALMSGQLTMVVLGFAALIAAMIGLMLPVIRRRLDALYLAEADRQAHLVETLHNMRAVKALVLEPVRRRLWEDGLATAISRQWDVGKVGALAAALTGLAERLMQVAVIGWGAVLVMDGAISLGTLVAFLMLAGRVTGPLVQVVALISEWQEASLSISLLKGVMDRPSERGPQVRPLTPVLTGAMQFEAVSFSYPGTSRPALNSVNLSIGAGQVVGIVGRSGSGKSTLMRLIQGIEVPQAGMIRLDGHDIRQIDLGHLRQSLGVVLQENLLFRGTVRANITAAHPRAGPEAVARAARLAGAEEFILQLPQGYDTQVEEGGANLSGGQRQRIAIARALLTEPRILVLDEATSALDPESEAVVNRNLAAMAAGRTVIVVSHRLSTLVRADMIVMLDQGRVLDIGPHAALLARCETYRTLWLQQTEHVA